MIISLAMCLILSLPSWAGAEDSNAMPQVDDLIVLGSRVHPRSAHDSPVPVDVLQGSVFQQYGMRDLDSLLQALVPSYNVNRQPIADAATIVRPANLRGLPPDSTLILVNGKRRHRSSVIIPGGGVSDGAHATDLATIPVIALKHVEIMRDGDSAQYGSDAIAGVIDLELKDAPESGTLETRWGQFYAGDGMSQNITGNMGLPLTLFQSGFVNLSFEYGKADSTSRSVQRADAQALIDAGNTHVRRPYVQNWGAPEVHADYKLLGNVGLNLTRTIELYGWGNYAERKIEGGFYYRHPNTRGGVFSRDEGETLLVADLSDDRRGCPQVETNPAADYSEVSLPDHCAVFNTQFPGGFTPTFGGTVSDWSGAAGLRGELVDWHYDLSAVWGQHRVDYFMTNTINPQLASLRDGIPTTYNPGADIERDLVVNLDFARSWLTPLWPTPLDVGVGLEYRSEEYEIEAGDRDSWFLDPQPGGLTEQGFGVGSNGFPGRPQRIAGRYNRDSYAAYVDLETQVTKDLLVGVAGRVEDYETFGSTVNGKVDARWQATPVMALRGSISTGFRAPTVGQANLQTVATVTIDGRLADRLVLPPSHASGVPTRLGAVALKPETSVNLSAGTVIDLNPLSVTLDYYRITVEDRIALSSNRTPSAQDLTALREYGFADITTIRFFTNAFATTTQGLDLVAHYPVQLGSGQTFLNLAANWNETTVTDRDRAIIDAQRVTELEQQLPNVRGTLTLDHRQGAWHVLSRLHYYDSFTEFTTDDVENRIDANPRWLVDLEASYTWSNGILLAVGGHNVLDTYPDRTNGAAGTKYPEFSPYGFNGGYYYVRALYAF